MCNTSPLVQNRNPEGSGICHAVRYRIRAGTNCGCGTTCTTNHYPCRSHPLRQRPAKTAGTAQPPTAPTQGTAKIARTVVQAQQQTQPRPRTAKTEGTAQLQTKPTQRTAKTAQTAGSVAWSVPSCQAAAPVPWAPPDPPAAVPASAAATATTAAAAAAAATAATAAACSNISGSSGSSFDSCSRSCICPAGAGSVFAAGALFTISGRICGWVLGALFTIGACFTIN